MGVALLFLPKDFKMGNLNGSIKSFRYNLQQAIPTYIKIIFFHLGNHAIFWVYI